MKKNARSVLGRGLSSLISSAPVSVVPESYSGSAAREVSSKDNTTSEISGEDLDGELQGSVGRHKALSRGGVSFVDINLVVNNPKQPRQEFDSQELSELSDSIKTLGVLQPVLVRPGNELNEGLYEIVAGERRWRAARLAGLPQLPVIIKNFDDRQTLEVALVENIQRAALNPVEEAQAYERLMTEYSLSQKDVAERVGKDRASVANALRILKLPQEILSIIGDGKLSMGHAKAILSIKEPAAQISLAKKVIAEGLSVRALEAIVSRVVVLDTGKRKGSPQNLERGEERYKPSAFPEIIDRLRLNLGTKVNIYHHPSGRGRIEIEYFSEQELDRIVDHVCSDDAK